MSVWAAQRRVEEVIPATTRDTMAYPLIRHVCRIPFRVFIRRNVINSVYAENGSCILACTHFNHVDPATLSMVLQKRIDWMARAEFYRRRWSAWTLNAIGAIRLIRNGVPVSAIRTAIHRVRGGRTIGIFPEGGIASGPGSVCRGARIKAGACLISMAAQVPIVPVVIVGSDSICRVRTFLPGKREQIWILFGKPMTPPACPPGRAAAAERRARRARFCADLQQRFVDLYAELRESHGVDDNSVP